MKQIAFILHGKIKNHDKIIAGLKTHFSEVGALTFLVTQRANHASELACTAVLNGATHIICMGGDGSLNEVINGIMSASADNLNDIRIGLLPYGTGNDFARTMGITHKIESLKAWIKEDSYRLIDLGWAEYYDGNGQQLKRYFVNITDVGIGGAIAQRLANSSKFWGSTITYQKAILAALLTYKNQPVNVNANSFNYESEVMSLIVANGKFFGGGMSIAPDALPDDNLFSVVIVGKISIFEYLMNLGRIKKSQKIEHPDVKYLSASELSIESLSRALPIDMDGEFAGYTPLKLKVVPAAIKFLCPK